MELETKLAMEAEDIRNDKELIERVAKAIANVDGAEMINEWHRLVAKAAINDFVDYYDPPQS